jgi:hypothetical protein
LLSSTPTEARSAVSAASSSERTVEPCQKVSPSATTGVAVTVASLLAKSLEEVKSVESDTMESRLRIKPDRSGSSLHRRPIELPGFASDEVWNGAVRWRRPDEVPLISVSEEIVGAHRRVLLDGRPRDNYRAVCDQPTTLSGAG